MPRNKGTGRAHKSGTGIKKTQVARRIISAVKVKSEDAERSTGGAGSADPALDAGACVACVACALA